MKKLLFSLLALSSALYGWSAGQEARITSTPSPAVSNKPLEVTISTGSLGSEVYCYTWCAKVNGASLTPSWGWNDVHTSKFRMEGSNGTYKITISSIKDFYGLSDSELEGLTSLGFIAKTSGGQQTEDLFVEVVQGRRDAYSGGEGTQADPFILKTSNDLAALASTPSDWAAGTCFALMADIDASSLTTPVGSDATPFAGVVYGNGHTIKNLTLSSTTFGSPVGLFGNISGGSISDLGVVQSSVVGTSFVGLLAGKLTSGRIERCFTAGNVSSTSICSGGLVGLNENGVINNCYSGATVNNSGDYAAGGLVGKNQGTISNTYSAGTVIGYDYVGGLVGANYGTVRNSIAMNAEVTAENDFVARFGGNNNSRNGIENNYSWDNITAGHYNWTQHGDHSMLQASDILRNEAQFASITGWDFNTVWDWRREGLKEYPVLNGLSNQECYLSDAYFNNSSAAEDLDATMISVGPNPTTGSLYLRASAGVAHYSVYSVGGNVIASAAGAGASEVVLDLSGEPEGMYIVKLSDMEGKVVVNKIIKK